MYNTSVASAHKAIRVSIKSWKKNLLFNIAVSIKPVVSVSEIGTITKLDGIRYFRCVVPLRGYTLCVHCTGTFCFVWVTAVTQWSKLVLGGRGRGEGLRSNKIPSIITLCVLSCTSLLLTSNVIVTLVFYDELCEEKSIPGIGTKYGI
jgi:hypothetical protein